MSTESSSPTPPDLGHTTSPQATPERPWLGLAPFTEADREYFYGRDAEVRELADRVRRAPLTVLYSVSGYGKSSLLGAGLIPVLRDSGHPVIFLRRCYDDLAYRPLQADVIEASPGGRCRRHRPGRGGCRARCSAGRNRRGPSHSEPALRTYQ